jgi:indole-3-glycerol phosphate synthase
MLHKSNCRFSRALWNYFHNGKIPVIPDIKPRSPQRGDLLKGRDPVNLAKKLAKAGAPALSVVTEPDYFGGSARLLADVAEATGLPVLRKDFITQSWQLRESMAMGAHAVLLIAAMLKREQLYELIEGCFKLGLEPLVETHSQEEVFSLEGIDLTVIGINNRSIVELEMDDGNVETTEKLAGLIKPGILVVSESAISTAADVERAAAAGAHAVLVGTAILQARDSAEMYAMLSGTGSCRL